MANPSSGLLDNEYQHKCNVCGHIFEIPDTAPSEIKNNLTSNNIKGSARICENKYSNGCAFISKWLGDKKTINYLCSKKCYDSYKKKEQCIIS